MKVVNADSIPGNPDGDPVDPGLLRENLMASSWFEAVAVIFGLMSVWFAARRISGSTYRHYQRTDLCLHLF